MERSVIGDIGWRLEEVYGDNSDYGWISVDVALDHLRLPDDSPDTSYVQYLCGVVGRAAERVTRRSLRARTLRLVLAEAPACGLIELPAPPTAAVTSIQYLGADGVLTTWDPANYQTSLPEKTSSARARIAPVPGVAWPTVGDGYLDPFRITFVTADYQPVEIVSGMLLMLGELYKQRSETVAGVSSTPAYLRARDLWLANRAY